jgi:hypothetical protein
MTTAADYLRETSLRMRDGYVDDCVRHASVLAKRLLDEGRKPWISIIRWIEQHGETRFHGPLIPLRFTGRNPPTWNTHYVCCCDGEAWDPLVGEPIAIETYTMTAFGKDLPVIERMNTDALERAIEQQSLRRELLANSSEFGVPVVTA